MHKESLQIHVHSLRFIVHITANHCLLGIHHSLLALKSFLTYHALVCSIYTKTSEEQSFPFTCI